MSSRPRPPVPARDPSRRTRSSTSTSCSRTSKAPSTTSSRLLIEVGRPPGRVYLDHAAGTGTLPEVRAALESVPAGNPSSPHGEGRAALAALDRARDAAARALGVEAGEAGLTSSGTEARNLAF